MVLSMLLKPSVWCHALVLAAREDVLHRTKDLSRSATFFTRMKRFICYGAVQCTMPQREFVAYVWVLKSSSTLGRARLHGPVVSEVRRPTL